MSSSADKLKDVINAAFDGLLRDGFQITPEDLGYAVFESVSIQTIEDFFPDVLVRDVNGLVDIPISNQLFVLSTSSKKVGQNYRLIGQWPCENSVFIKLYERIGTAEQSGEPVIEDLLEEFKSQLTEEIESTGLEDLPKEEDAPSENAFQRAFFKTSRELSIQSVQSSLEDVDEHTYNSWLRLKDRLTDREREAIEWVLLNAGLSPTDFDSLQSDYGIYFLKLVGALSHDWIIESTIYDKIGILVDTVDKDGRPTKDQKQFSISKWQLDFLVRIAHIVRHSLDTRKEAYFTSLEEIAQMGTIFRLGTGTGKTMAILTLAMLFAYNYDTGRIAAGQQGKVIVIQPKNLLTNEFGISLHNLLNTRCGLMMVYDEQETDPKNVPADAADWYYSKLLKEDLDSLENLYSQGNIVEDGLGVEEEDINELPGEVTQNAKNALSEAKTRLNVAAYSKTLTPLNHTFLVSTPEKAQNLLGNSYLKLSDDRSNKSLKDMVRCVLIDEGHLIVDANRGFILDEIAVYLRIIDKPFFIFSGTINDVIIASLKNTFFMKVYEIPSDIVPKGVGRHTVNVYRSEYFNQYTSNELVLNGTTKIYGLEGAKVWLPAKTRVTKQNTRVKDPGFFGKVIKHGLLRLLFGEDSPMKFFQSYEYLAGSLKAGYKNLLNEFRVLVFYQSKIGLEALYAYLVVFAYYVSPDVQRVFKDANFSSMTFEEFPFSLGIVQADLESIITKCEEYVLTEVLNTDKKFKENFDFLKQSFDHLIAANKPKAIAWLGFRIGFLFYHASMADNVITHDDNMLKLSDCINGSRNAKFPCNLIVCTSVIQEGVNPAPLSLLMCDQWSYNNLILEEWRQIRGRVGRQKPGDVILLLDKKSSTLKYSNFNSDVVRKHFPSNLFYKRYFFAYQYLQILVDRGISLEMDEDSLSQLLKIFSVAGLFKPIDYVNPNDYSSPEQLLEAYESAQVRILNNLPQEMVIFLQIIFQRRLRIPILDAAFLMYTAQLCKAVMSRGENIGPIIVACAICLTFLKDKVKSQDYEESITQNKTLSNIITKNYTKMYSVELPREFSGELVRFSKRLYCVITGHMNIFKDNYQAVPFEFLEAIFPTLKMMNDLALLCTDFPSLSEISHAFMATYNTISNTLRIAVEKMNMITSQSDGVYSYISGTPKTLPGKKAFKETFASRSWQVALDNNGERLEKFLLGLLNVSESDYKTISKLVDRIKALLTI